MSYAMSDVEVTRPLPVVELSEGDSGVALLVRRRGRPIGWTMTALPVQRVLAADDVDAIVGRSLAAKLVEEAIIDELGGHALPGPVDLTAAVCSRDRPDWLFECLRSVLALGEVTEILVVDNAPSDGRTREMVEGLPGVRYVCEPKPGLDFARNRALAEATSEYIAFLDDDVVVDAGWLEGVRECLAEHPDAKAVTGLVVAFELATRYQVAFESRGGFRRGFDKLRYRGDRLAGNTLYPYGAGIFGAGCNMILQRRTVLALGGFDEALDTGRPLPGGGDLDIFQRIIAAGHPLVYEPSCLVFHRHRRDRRALRRQYWTWGTGFMAFVSKCHRRDRAARPRLYRLVAWWVRYESAELARSLVGRSPMPPDVVAAELVGGIVGLAGTYGRSQRRSERIRHRFE